MHLKYNKYIELIKKIILKKLDKSENVKIIFFGSRASGQNITQGSDVDVAIEGDFRETDFIALKEELEEAPIPYEVDLINLNVAEDNFKEKIYKEGIFWKN
jgi:predicted nucleotidyltransferase